MKQINADELIRQKITDFERQASLPDADALWQKMYVPAPRKNTLPFVRVMRNAAALVLLSTVIWAIWQIRGPQATDSHFMATRNEVNQLPESTTNDNAPNPEPVVGKTETTDQIVESEAKNETTADSDYALNPDETTDPSFTGLDAEETDDEEYNTNQ